MNSGEDSFRYEEMPDDVMAEACNFLIEAIREFKFFFQNRFAKEGKECILETPDGEILLDANVPLLMEILRRIDQRADYYLYFHSDKNRPTRMSQTKEAALLAFWVLKYKPLSLSLWDYAQANSLFIKKACTVNEYFAAYCIMSYIRDVLDVAGKTFNFSDEEYDRLVYDFMHRDFSKEAIICYVRSFLREVEH